MGAHRDRGSAGATRKKVALGPAIVEAIRETAVHALEQSAIRTAVRAVADKVAGPTLAPTSLQLSEMSAEQLEPRSPLPELSIAAPVLADPNVPDDGAPSVDRLVGTLTDAVARARGFDAPPLQRIRLACDQRGSP